MRSRASLRFARPGLPFILLSALFAILWIAGGSSRGDVAGQAIVRGGAWGVLVVACLFATRPSLAGLRPVAALMLAVLAVPALQLVPLPPGLWLALPGRAALGEVVALAGMPDAWRPLSLVPVATWNALSSLVVPAAVLALVAMLTEEDWARLPGLLLAVIAASVAVALLQFTGARFAQPLINYTGDVSGMFANRNHFALLAAMGCAVAPVWAVGAPRPARGRLMAAAAAIVLFVLAVLASGSRAGMLATLIALAAAPLVVRERLRAAFRGLPPRLPLLVGGALAVTIVALIGLSVAFGRAVSINRLVTLDVGEDMRSRGLPVVIAMTREYFPAGIGVGGFDPLFRLHEPFALLKPTYFNQAHNDLLGVVLDAGAGGLAVLAAALGWWAWASVRIWSGRTIGSALTGRLASVMLLLAIGASIVDYPLRTPMMMAVVVLAAAWLSRAAIPLDKPDLPR